MGYGVLRELSVAIAIYDPVELPGVRDLRLAASSRLCTASSIHAALVAGLNADGSSLLNAYADRGEIPRIEHGAGVSPSQVTAIERLIAASLRVPRKILADCLNAFGHGTFENLIERSWNFANAHRFVAELNRLQGVEEKVFWSSVGDEIDRLFGVSPSLRSRAAAAFKRGGFDAARASILEVASDWAEGPMEDIAGDLSREAAYMRASTKHRDSRPQLPVIVKKPSGAEIRFDGAVDNDVDLTAAECLELMLSKFPHAIGIGHLCNGQPARAISKLPDRLRKRCKSDGPGKGYRFEP